MSLRSRESIMGQILDDQDQGRHATTSIGWLLDRWRLAEANFADQEAPGITWELSDKGTRGTASKVQIEREKALADTIW